MGYIKGLSPNKGEKLQGSRLLMKESTEYIETSGLDLAKQHKEKRKESQIGSKFLLWLSKFRLFCSCRTVQ